VAGQGLISRWPPRWPKAPVGGGEKTPDVFSRRRHTPPPATRTPRGYACRQAFRSGGAALAPVPPQSGPIRPFRGPGEGSRDCARPGAVKRLGVVVKRAGDRASTPARRSPVRTGVRPDREANVL